MNKRDDAQYMDKWQSIVDSIVDIYNVPSVNILKLDYDCLQVYVKSKNKDNLYEVGEKIYLTKDAENRQLILDCDSVEICNYLELSRYICLKHKMKNCYIVPIKLPNDDLFGLICLVSDEELLFSKNYNGLLYSFASAIEEDVAKNLAVNVSKNNNDELKGYGEDFKKIINMLPDAIIIRNDKKVKFMNEAAYEMLGIDKKEFSSNTLINYTIKPYYNHEEIAGELLKDIKREKIVSKREEEIVTLDGKKILVNMTSLFIKYKNEKCLLSILKDITLNKKIQEYEIKSHKEKIIKEFISNISHEFRTPLNNMLGSIRINEKYILENNLEKVHKYRMYMKKNCYRLLKYVNNIENIIKIEQNELNPSLRIVNIVEVIENIVESAVPYIEENNIKIVFDTEVEECYAKCDCSFMEIILLNILSNCVKFRRTKEDSFIYVNVLFDDNKVKISVEDNGIGISSEKQDVIFDLFEQVDKSYTRSSEGSGLGLYIVKHLVLLQGGKVGLTSTEGSGSEFIIEFPFIHEFNEQSAYHGECTKTVDLIKRTEIEFSDI